MIDHLFLLLKNEVVGCQVASCSDLLLTLPQDYAQQLSQDMGLQILPLPYELPFVSAYLYWYSIRKASPSLQWLRGLLNAP